MRNKEIKNCKVYEIDDFILIEGRLSESSFTHCLTDIILAKPFYIQPFAEELEIMEAIKVCKTKDDIIGLLKDFEDGKEVTRKQVMDRIDIESDLYKKLDELEKGIY